MSREITAFEAAPLESRMRYAEALAHGGDLLPRGLRDASGKASPGKILLVAETGRMLGMDPIAALQGVNIIDGKPTLSPALMSAVVRRAGHRLRVTTSGSVKEGTFEATATLIRSDDPEYPFSATWNAERAQRAGLVNKSNWKNYFEAMCKARAISEVCREGAEDALMGVGYVPEELGALVDEQGVVIEGEVVEDDPAPAPKREKAAPVQESIPLAAPSQDWVALAGACKDRQALREVYRAAEAAGELGIPVTEGGPLVRDVISGLAGELPEQAPEWSEPTPEPSEWDESAVAPVVDLSEREAARVAAFGLDVPDGDDAA